MTVSNLSFTRNANPPGHDAVSISFTMAYNTVNVQQAFSQLFQSSVEHVSAATFDTGVFLRERRATGKLRSTWSSVNGVINFSGNNVGIGSADTSPAQQLEVNGGVRLYPNGVSEPTCNSSVRGTLWFVNNGGSAGQPSALRLERIGNGRLANDLLIERECYNNFMDEKKKVIIEVVVGVVVLVVVIVIVVYALRGAGSAAARVWARRNLPINRNPRARFYNKSASSTSSTVAAVPADTSVPNKGSTSTPSNVAVPVVQGPGQSVGRRELPQFQYQDRCRNIFAEHGDRESGGYGESGADRC